MIEPETLEELGLSKNEGKVYETLVKHGKLSAGEVSKKSEVPYGRIYDVLNSLHNKGLIEIIPEKTKKFTPSDPESLKKLVEQKEKKLEKAKEKIKEMKKFYEVKEKNPVAMVFGKKGFYKIVKESKNIEKYGYAIKWTSEYRPDWARKRENNIKKGKDLKSLTRYDEETKNNIKKWIKIDKNIHQFHNEGVALSITDDDEVMLGLIKSNVTLLIKDKPFAKVMKQLFLDSYNAAELIK